MRFRFCAITSDMIGPHERKELELMLSGEKPMAMFSDYIPEGGKISEEIIPEQAFAPYVEQGRFVRLEHDVAHDILIGKLLGYSDENIEDFVS